jgi:uncharacterized protein YifN (PemK superfamily)
VLDKALAPAWPELSLWVKCDMLNTLATSRLDRFHMRINNARKYYDRRISENELLAIRRCIAAYLAISLDI